MKHLSFTFLIASLLLNACQNSDNSAKPGPNTANQAAVAHIPSVNVPQFEIAIQNAQAVVDDLEKMVKSLYDVPAGIKKKNPAEIKKARETLAGMLDKQQHMLAEAKEKAKALGEAEKNGTPFQSVDSLQVGGYMAQFKQTEDAIQQMTEEIKKLTEGQ